MRLFSAMPQELGRGRLHEREACQACSIAQRDCERHESAEGMTDEMDRTACRAHDRLHHVGLVPDGRIGRSAALRGAAVPERARRHAAKSALPGGDQRTPGCSSAARARHEHYCRAVSAHVIVDTPACVFDHPGPLGAHAAIDISTRLMINAASVVLRCRCRWSSAPPCLRRSRWRRGT